jgi:NapH/MauN family ferredoxin-type protein
MELLNPPTFRPKSAKQLSPGAAWRRRIVWTQRARHLTQGIFVGLILYSSLLHQRATEDGTTASIDALCPFGGIETLWRTLSTGQYIPKTHQSNVILLIALAIATFIAGGAFCGWVCPFGAVQDFLTSVRRKLRLPEIRVPSRLDRILRYGRYLVLGLILYQTIITVKLWFADFDPYRTLFGLGWLFEFNPVVEGTAYVTTVVVLVLSLFVERAWCRYACPLGGAISLLGKFSLLRIRRTDMACKGCSLCERPCPVKLPVATATVISSDCIGCLACVDTCPRHDALNVKLAPVWLDFIRAIRQRFLHTKTAKEVSHAR